MKTHSIQIQSFVQLHNQARRVTQRKDYEVVAA